MVQSSGFLHQCRQQGCKFLVRMYDDVQDNIIQVEKKEREREFFALR